MDIQYNFAKCNSKVQLNYVRLKRIQASIYTQTDDSTARQTFAFLLVTRNEEKSPQLSILKKKIISFLADDRFFSRSSNNPQSRVRN